MLRQPLYKQRVFFLNGERSSLRIIVLNDTAHFRQILSVVS